MAPSPWSPGYSPSTIAAVEGFCSGVEAARPRALLPGMLFLQLAYNLHNVSMGGASRLYYHHYVLTASVYLIPLLADADLAAAAPATSGQQPEHAGVAPVSELTQQQLALVDRACYQHRRKPGSSKAFVADAPTAVVTSEEESLYAELVPLFTSSVGGINFKDMACEWNARHRELQAQRRAGSIRPKHAHHLKRHHTRLIATQASQLSMLTGSAGGAAGEAAAPTPSGGITTAALPQVCE